MHFNWCYKEDSVVQWANQNNMALHEDKFELMVHKIVHNHSFQLHTFTFLKQALAPLVEQICYLGRCGLVRDLLNGAN